MINGNKPLTELIYEQIYSDVVNGFFKQDEILTESKLIQRYGASKSPVREALISLCDERVLQSIPRTGYRIVHFTIDEVRQITETRQALELFMFERCFTSIQPNQWDQLEECNEAIRRKENSDLPPFTRWESNVSFHMMLASFANNDYMAKLLKDTLRINARAMTQYFQNLYSPELEDTQYAHERLIAAGRAGNYAAARSILIEDTNQLFRWEVRRP